jgi:hypothetical protein
MNKEFLQMQKLAGLITEGQYKANLNEMSEENLVSTLKENGFEVSSNPAWIVRNSETGDDYILYTESGDYISHKLDGDFPEGVKIMGEGADDWLEQFLETEKKTELNENIEDYYGDMEDGIYIAIDREPDEKEQEQIALAAEEKFFVDPKKIKFGKNPYDGDYSVYIPNEGDTANMLFVLKKFGIGEPPYTSPHLR